MCRVENRRKQLQRKSSLHGDTRSDMADGLGIEAMEKHHKAEQNDDPVLDGPNVTGVDERWHVENVLGRTGLSPTHGFYPARSSYATTSAATVPDGTKGSAKN